MIPTIVNLLLLLGLFLYHSCAITITNWSRNRNLENQRLTTNIGVLTTPSVITCAVECANIPPCMSYSYHAGNSTCLLYSIPFTGETAAVSQDGWESYNSMCGNGPTALDYFYKRNLNMCYHLESDGKKNITGAMLFCSVDGRMLRINTLEKQVHIAEFLTSLPFPLVFIGGLDESRNGSFLYEDGTPLTFFFWSPSDPKAALAIGMRRNISFKWGNVKGDTIRPFLCEIAL